MTVNSESTFSCKNPASFGIYSISSKTEMERVRRDRRRKRKFTFWVAFIVFLFFTLLIILLVLDMLNSSKAIKNVKTKRFVESNNLDYYEDVKTVHRISEEKITSDVRIVPENSLENRRMSRYPNHRYDAMESKDKLYEKMMKEVYVENGWYPKPLIQKGRGGPLNNIQDIISRGRTSGEVGRKRTKGTNQFSSPIRLDGVYIRATNEKDKDQNRDRENGDNYNYLKRINDLIQSDSVDNDEEENWIRADAFKIRGSPFRKSPKAANIPRKHESNQGKRKNQLSKSELKKEKEMSPITILLDFRSESETGDNELRNDDGSEGEEFIIKRKPKNEIIYIPINSRNAFHDSMVGSETKFSSKSKYLRNKNLNNMVIKLNLYPKAGKRKRQHSHSHLGKAIPHHVKMGQRRTFGLFSKKKDYKECPIFGLKSQGHTIKAKWKTKNGDWIHSENVVVNRFGDESKR